MCDYWDKKFLDELIFEKCELKSPIGNGLFDIYINKKELIIYKKIRCKIDNITKYKNIIYNLKTKSILNKYIYYPEKVNIEDDGSYYSKLIENGIRLYDINSNTQIDIKILKKILDCVKYLQNDLNEYVKTKILNGDWALHNLIYCLDMNKIYNIDLEGFYTYPYIHNNGNCHIKYCNERFNNLINNLDKNIYI